MAEEGLPYAAVRTHTYNSRLAQELGKWAVTQPGGEAIHDAIYRAYFVDTVNIGQIDELVRIAGETGLDAKVAREVLEMRSFQDAVDADWRRAGELGISGVPTFVAGQLGVVGAQPYEMLVQLVEKAREAADPSR
jgi:predicted DsbA family dithiol-disulfide isomerase